MGIRSPRAIVRDCRFSYGACLHWGAWLWLAWLAELGGCKATPATRPVSAARFATPTSSAGSEAPATAPSAHTQEGVKLWLRSTQLLDAPEGQRIAELDRPIIVELLPDGRVRAAVSPSRIVEGYVPKQLTIEPTIDAGFGLYVQQQGSLSLEPGGPEIGRVLKGAYLPVVQRAAAVTNVVVPNYYDRGRMEPSVGLHIGDLRAFVNTAILGTAPQPLEAPVLPGRPIRDRRVDLFTARAGIAFTETRCGDFRLIDEAETDATGFFRVAQYNNGIEIVGWAFIDSRAPRGHSLCPSRVVLDNPGHSAEKSNASSDARPIPSGFVRVADRPRAIALRLGKLIRDGASVFIPMLSEERAEQDLVRCTRFQFRHVNSTASQASLEGQVTGHRGRPFPLRYAVFTTGSTLSLAAGGGFAAALTLVEVSNERLVFVRGTPGTDPIDAYHPDDAEIWFRSRAICERDASAQSASTLWP